MSESPAYLRTRDRVETYFDRTATKTWERLTSDAPVSGIRATVRAGRDQMRAMMLDALPEDLRGARVLDAGCGTGAAACALADRGADVVGVDISPSIIEIAERRRPTRVRGSLQFSAGDMFDPKLGRFDFAFAMDSMIYYEVDELGSILADFAPRLRERLIFTLPPKTPLLSLMWRVGKLFPRSDRSPSMVPHSPKGVAQAVRQANARGSLKELDTVNCGFYHSTALGFTAEGAQ